MGMENLLCNKGIERTILGRNMEGGLASSMAAFIVHLWPLFRRIRQFRVPLASERSSSFDKFGMVSLLA